MVFVHTLLAVKLIVLASAGPMDVDLAKRSPPTVVEKSAIVQEFVNRATDCVVHAVESNSQGPAEAAHVGELIVAAMPACVDPMRAMIDSFDRNFGDGAGETFFTGAYLDALPRAVSKRISR